MIIDNIVLGVLAGVFFCLLLYIAELTAHKFYSKAEIQYDIISVRAPFIIFGIICVLLPILFKSILILGVFGITTILSMFLFREELKCKH